jgi:ferrous-iron efflux pump FieF
MSIANPYLHSQNPDSVKTLNLKRWATVASLSVATLLICLKAFAFLITDSVSLLSSLMDSCFDALASLVTMISVRHAMTPADEEHRFGHGKMEALSALAQAVFISGSAIFLLFEALQRFLKPRPVLDVATGIYVMIFSIVLTGVLIAFQIFVIRKTKSIAISADHLHYKGDLMMNLGVFMCLTLSLYFPWPYFDPIFATVISLILLSGAREITRESFDILLDKELPHEDREKILALINEHKDVSAVHDLRTRSTGERIFIEFHLEIDGRLTLKKAHDITEDIERVLFEAYPKSEVIIHQEPAGIDDHRLDDSIADAASA